jgi:hypothetical protein
MAIEDFIDTAQRGLARILLGSDDPILLHRQSRPQKIALLSSRQWADSLASYCSSRSRGEALASAPRLRLALRGGAGSAAGSDTASMTFA